MDASTALWIAAGAIVVLALVFVSTTSARRDRARALHHLSRETVRKDRSMAAVEAIEEEQPRTGRAVERAAAVEQARRLGGAMAESRAAPPPAPYVDEETLGVTRRQFLNRGIVGFFTLGLSGFGAASLAFLWPSLSGGFGAKIRAGKADDILGEMASKREPFYVPEARTYLAPYPKASLGKAKDAYSESLVTGMEQGLVALYQKCVHLGCRVPWCHPAQWFECPCHGSRYNRVGEKKGGPAPRGLDRFPVEVDGGVVVINTGQLILGPPVGVDTTGQQPEGPHCA